MAKRFSDSTLWDRDWFINLKGKFQLFCLFLRDNCDHAGVWQPSFSRFEFISGYRIKLNEYVESVNVENERIIFLENKKIWIVGFIEDQYKTKILNDKDNAIKGVIKSLQNNQVPYLSYGYKLAPMVGLGSPLVGAQDKDKDKGSSYVSESDSCIDSSSLVLSSSSNKKFKKPTIEELAEYCKERKNTVDPEAFIAFYESKGWKVGNQAMRSWRAAVITWEKRTEKHKPQKIKITADMIHD